MSRRHNARLIKSHLTYTAAELAELLRVTVITVYHWKKEGLTPIDGKRPFLFAAAEIVAFLARKNAPRQPLQLGEIFCVACRRPCGPAGGRARVVPMGATSVELIGHCPDKGHECRRRVRIADLPEHAASLELSCEDATVPLGGTSDSPRIAASMEVGA